jgi:hypothetical protein
MEMQGSDGLSGLRCAPAALILSVPSTLKTIQSQNGYQGAILESAAD